MTTPAYNSLKNEPNPEFSKELYNIYHSIKDAKIKYNPTRYKEIIDKNEAVLAARKLVNDPNLSKGLEILYLNGMLHLSVEYLILQDQWRILFTETDLLAAEKKLKSLNFDYKTVSV